MTYSHNLASQRSNTTRSARWSLYVTIQQYSILVVYTTAENMETQCNQIQLKFKITDIDCWRNKFPKMNHSISRIGSFPQGLKLRVTSTCLISCNQFCVRVGASDNDSQIRVDWLSKERKEGRGEWWAERKKSEGLTSFLLCHVDKSGDGESQWTQITSNYRCNVTDCNFTI